MSHPVDDATALRPQPDGSFEGRTSPAFANMVGPFGGITAAQALSAVLLHPQRLGDPVSFTVNFPAALADGAFVVDARPVRTNRSTQHWTVEMRQGNGVVTTATAVTAVRRETWSVDDLPPPEALPPAQVERLVGRAPVEWVKRYEMRPIVGRIPMVWDGSGDSSLSQLWVRDDPPRALDFASLTALSDIFFPRIWLRRATRTPIGTISMTVFFHADARALAAVGDGYLLGQARAQAFRNGYFDQSAQLWSEAGTLLVTTHQLVYYKE